MKAHRNKLSLAVALIAASSMAQAEIELTEKLSLSGFIDMSSTYVESEIDSPAALAVDSKESETSSGLDQFELNFLYSFDDKLSAVVDLEHQDDGRTVVDDNGDTVAIGEETDIEQAYFSYAVTDSFSVKGGRFLSYAGWETEDPTGLFQYSGAGYAGYFYGGYQQGMSALYSADMFAVAVSVVNDLGDLEGEFRDSKKPAVETMLAFMPTDTWTTKVFYSTDENEGLGPNDEDITLINAWTSFAIGDLLLAGEYNKSENNPVYATAPGDEASGYLLMANYAFGKAGLTVRYHDWTLEDKSGVAFEEVSGITVAPSYALTDNLLIVAEFRTDDIEYLDAVDGQVEATSNSYALEALVTF
ncbi:MAG: outer membrane beta-barrel protein [Gammaproteobacteria bacterium]|nr:outer membrane beta-barrel protein [Gammaproteobacteria bacterium]MBQ0774469.1 outer membrane beta-barrel protein [Gammaproteobacteria bacterium]